MSLLMLVISFVASGLGMVTNKALVQSGLDRYREAYLLTFYATPMLIGLAVMAVRPSKRTPMDWRVGIGMGAVNVFSTLFLLIALHQLQGIVAFPIRNVGNIVMTGLVSILAWKERLSRSQWAGIILALVAVWLIY